MKKKDLKKLVLNRETLAELDRFDLWQAHGGATVTCRPDFCDFSGRNTCTTCQLTCTTNYC
jgi:hypothetical protein